MKTDVIAMIESLAEHGHAPKRGCNLFGVGYEDAFHRLRRTYLERRFERGSSAEKFVVGPYGSGKTHFLRQLLEMSEEIDCVTVEIALHRDIDFTDSLLVFSEVAREVRAPGSSESGIKSLLHDALNRIRNADGIPADQRDLLIKAWVDGLKNKDYKLQEYGKVLHQTIESILHGDDDVQELGVQWLSGNFAGKEVCKNLAVSPITKSERNVFGSRALHSLFQFIRHANYRGTVVGFDEAEQGFNVDRKKRTRILSLLQSGINAITDLEDGSALVIFALTPDVIEEMESFAALQQRVRDPGPGLGFFEGNTLAPKIDLARRKDPEEELTEMGLQLVALLYEHAGEEVKVERGEVESLVGTIASEVATSELSSSNRRTLIKRVSATLIRLYDTGMLVNIPAPETEVIDDEV